ncbi:Hypothetical predicted protein [Octopus vulgaris]|uniref:Uncharacterized protein n=1 Tax=Octopus vulgaris TaxID=6645 RepID=A0AA36BE69_OCTVU|nr:Hypothetical predicted protein [Octopus vulgaris]
MASKRTGCSLLQVSPPLHERVSLKAPNSPFHVLKGKEGVLKERASTCSVPNKTVNEDVICDVFENFPPLPATHVPVLEKHGRRSVPKRKNDDGVKLDVNEEFPSTSATALEKEANEMTNNHTDITNSNDTKSHYNNNFASIMKQNTEKIEISFDEIKSAKELLRKEGNSVLLNTPQQLINETKKKDCDL